MPVFREIGEVLNFIELREGVLFVIARRYSDVAIPSP